MCPKCQKSVTQYVAAASVPKEITKRGTTYILAQVVPWELCKIYDLPYSNKWYEHSPAARDK